MKRQWIYIISAVLMFTVCMVLGMACKRTYSDFNSENNPLERFTVGLLSEDMCVDQVELMQKTLSDSNYIIAAKVLDRFHFLPSCTTQRVEVVKTFRGDSLNEGEQIDIICSQEIFWDESSYELETAYINMGFANELDVGETYLLFLDQEIETYGDEKMFIKSDDYLLSPFFSYDEINYGWSKNESDDPDIMNSKYTSVKMFDFFLSSEKSVYYVNKLRDSLISEYTIKD